MAIIADQSLVYQKAFSCYIGKKGKHDPHEKIQAQSYPTAMKKPYTPSELKDIL